MDSMMLKETLLENGYEDAVVFENPSFADAAIGVSESGSVIYDYDLMVESAMNEEGWTEEEAIDWIDYNAIRALSYFPEPRPIIMYKLIS